MKKVSPLIYFLRRMLHYFGIGLLIVLLLFLWSLYRGPIAVPYLKPYIIQALNYDENDYEPITLPTIFPLLCLFPIK